MRSGRCATACFRLLPSRLACRPISLRRFFANEAHANLRFLHYPPQEAIEDNAFGQAPHTDNSFMTALARADVPGLAVRLPSGEWFAPPIIPGTFLINLANIMRRWSNDRFCRPRTASSTSRGPTAIRSPTSTARTRIR
jgi:isopenicillin N synthase-like dioxygenase